MKKYKKIICIIIAACILAGSAFAALDFMGVINPDGVNCTEEKGETIKDENEISDTYVSPWHIVFKGYAFSVKPVGTAIIHESGCLNIRSCDDYLIQIDVEDKRMADFWDNREQLKKSIEGAGYVFELNPEKYEINEKEYIRYIVSLENERGAKFDKTYFSQLICDAGDNQRFFTSIRFDGTDVDAMGREERTAIYEKAADEAAAIMAGTIPTDEADDMMGSYWQEKETIDTGEADSVVNGDAAVSYKVPENFDLINEDISGKTYYSDADKLTVMTSIVPYSWMTASELAEKSYGAGISRITEEGEHEVNGVSFYYYTYSILYKKMVKEV